MNGITSQNILKIIQQTMREEENLTRESSETNMWSEEHQVFYYSNFDLFNSTQCEEEFYQFSMFIEKVSNELGSEWRTQANLLFSPYLSSKQVFMNLLELWLRHHPPVNSLRPSGNKFTTFNPSYVSEFLRMMETELAVKHPSRKVNAALTSLKAVCLGFFMTANEIWGEMFQTEPVQRRLETFSANNLIKDITSSIQKTFRPLMVVTEKISSVFGRKKRKFNEEAQQQDCNQAKFENCYHEFRRTLDIEKQLERKMSDFSLEDCEPEIKNKVIEKKQFRQSESPLQPSLLSSVYSYVTDFLNRNPSWQVASNFVTQILELNQVRMEEGQKVKVMRPAQDFYRKLVMVWLVCQQNSKCTVPFQDYLIRLKSTFFNEGWQDKYIVPTKYFYERMKQDWQEIKNENKQEVMNEKEIFNSFIRRIKRTMKVDWDHKIKINKPR